MYISSKFICQLSFNWQLILIEGCPTQSWCVYLLNDWHVLYVFCPSSGIAMSELWLCSVWLAVVLSEVRYCHVESWLSSVRFAIVLFEMRFCPFWAVDVFCPICCCPLQEEILSYLSCGSALFELLLSWPRCGSVLSESWLSFAWSAVVQCVQGVILASCLLELWFCSVRSVVLFELWFCCPNCCPVRAADGFSSTRSRKIFLHLS